MLLSDTLTVLVAEDDPRTLDLVHVVLHSRYYSVVTVGGGREALEYLHDATPDLVMLGVHAPGMRGLDVAQRMRGVSRLKRVPLVILAALTDEGLRDEAGLLGTCVFLTKPFSSRMLSETIERLLATQLERVRLSQYKTELDMSPLEERPSPERRPAGFAQRLLLLEGNRAVRELMRSTLQREGYRVEAVASVAEAQGALAGRFDLVVLDLGLPDFAGQGFLRLLYRRLPVLVLSKSPQDIRLVRELRLKDDAYLPKPFTPRDLLVRVGRLLNP